MVDDDKMVAPLEPPPDLPSDGEAPELPPDDVRNDEVDE